MGSADQRAAGLRFVCYAHCAKSVTPQRAHPGLDSGATPSMAALATDPAQHAVTSCIAGMICVSLIVRALLASSSSSHLIIVCQTSSARSLNKTSNKVAI